MNTVNSSSNIQELGKRKSRGDFEEYEDDN
jgi:hypothetical protein